MKTILKITLIVVCSFFINQLQAQRTNYTFSYKYVMEITNPRGSSTIIEYYLPTSSGYFGSKIDGTFTIFDNEAKKMHLLLDGDVDEKTKMTMPFSLTEIIGKIGRDTDLIVTKQERDSVILGYPVELYTMDSNDLKTEVWVANSNTEGSFGENSGTQFGYYLMVRLIDIGDDFSEGILSGLPMRIVSYKKRRNRVKITTMQCIDFSSTSLSINLNDYGSL